MGKKSGPPPPDYTGAAQAQSQASQDIATQNTWANRPNQSTPWGSVSWNAQQGTDPATGKPITQWNQTTQLDPRLQNALDSQIQLQQGRSDLANGLMPRAQAEFSAPMDWGQLSSWAQGPQQTSLSPTTGAFGFGPGQQRIDTSRGMVPQLNTGLDAAPTLSADVQPVRGFNTSMGGDAGNVQRGLDYGGLANVDNAGATRQRAEDAIYQSAASRLDPQWNQRQQQLEADLANRGISMNSGAYTRAMDDFSRSRNDAYAQAQQAAITGGGAEAQRDFGMNLGLRQQQQNEANTLGNFYNTAQQQAFGQDLSAGQANNAALGQQYGLNLQGLGFNNQALQNQFSMGQQARQQQQGAQQAQFGMNEAARAQQLAAQQAALGQQQQAFGQQQAANAQNFGQGLQAATFQNQMRQQQLAEAMQRRGFSLNEINALMNGQQVQMPGFTSYNQASQGQAPDLLGAMQAGYQSQLNASNSQNALMGQGLGSLANLGMSYMMFG